MLWVAAALIIVVALIVAFAMRKPDPLEEAAPLLGLKLSRSVPDLLPRIEGMVEGVAIKLDVPAQGAAVRYRIFYPALGMALRLERETTITRTLGDMGATDREIGVKNFDDSFRVNTSRPDVLQKMMTPELRRALLAALDRHPSLRVADGELTLISDNHEASAHEIAATTREFVGIAKLLLANKPPPLEKPAPRPVVPRQDSKPAPPQAQTEPSQQAESAPSPPAERQRKTPPSAPTPVPREPVAAEPPPPAPPPPPSTGLPEGFFEEVFGKNRMSFEQDEQFEAELRGTEVNLSGTVKQASPYTDREDFTPATGTKAVITVARIETDLYGKSDIDAVVYLHGSATLDRGERAEFSGRLDGVDPFMRNLFVMDARLEN